MKRTFYLLLILLVGSIVTGYVFINYKNSKPLNNNELQSQIEMANNNLSGELPDDQSVLLDDNRPDKFKSPEAKKIKSLIPSDYFLRDFVALQKDNSYLAIYVINPELEPMNSVLDYNSKTGEWFYQGCFAMDFGQTILGSKYVLAYIKNDRIINEINIPFPDYEKWPDYKFDKPDENGAIGYSDINDPKGTWMERGSLTFRQSRCSLEPDYFSAEDWKCKYSMSDFVEIPLLKLEDLTGDGIANEVRIMTEYISCGNNYFVIVGYDSKSDKAIIYPIIDNDGSHKSYSNFNPKNDGVVVFDSGCDHGSEKHELINFQFDDNKKAYIQKSQTGYQTCDWMKTDIKYSDLIKLNPEKLKSHLGSEIAWKGKIASRYSQIDGIKFCIVDDGHVNPDVHSDCEWFWAIPKELATKYDPTNKSDWTGNWNKYVFDKYSEIEYDKIISENDTFLVTGIIEDIDYGADGLNRPVPNIVVTKIEKAK